MTRSEGVEGECCRFAFLLLFIPLSGADGIFRIRSSSRAVPRADDHALKTVSVSTDHQYTVAYMLRW